MPYVIVETADSTQFPYKVVSGRYAKRGNAERAQIIRQYQHPGLVVRIMDVDSREVIGPKPGEKWGG